MRLWHYLPRTWNGTEAEKLYRGPVIKAPKKHRPQRKSYNIIEDNDPTGYKSNAAIKAKEELKVTPMVFPLYSPDLNPLDFFLWAEVQRRMAAQTPRRRESASDY